MRDVRQFAEEGQVVCTDQTLDAITPALYEENARVIKATSMYVRRAIESAVLSGYKTSPATREQFDLCCDIREYSEIVILIGLRTGNRTIVDISSFATLILGAICDVFPRAAIVIDGQNASGDFVYDCFGDKQTEPDSFLRQELEIAQVLSSYASTRGVRLINNVGRPVMESVLLCDAADFFVAPWGAALAKYRWICNKPGLVLTGRWNLQNRTDLDIYHGPAYNENPAEMWFNELDAVEDVVDASETDITVLERGNFTVNSIAIWKQLVKLLETHSRRSTRGV